MTTGQPFESYDDAKLQTHIKSLRVLKEQTQTQLRLAVAEQDRRAMIADILKRHPKASQLLRPAGIPSQEQVGEPQ